MVRSYSIEVDLDDYELKNVEELSTLLNHDFNKLGAIRVVVEATPVKGYPETHWEPGEPDSIEDFHIYTYKRTQFVKDLNLKPELIEITDYVADNKLGELEEKLMEVAWCPREDDGDY